VKARSGETLFRCTGGSSEPEAVYVMGEKRKRRGISWTENGGGSLKNIFKDKGPRHWQGKKEGRFWPVQGG